MASKLSTDRARRFCRVLKADTSGRPMHWRGILPIAERAGIEDPPEAVAAAVEEGWLEVADGHSVCLTDKGRQL